MRSLKLITAYESSIFDPVKRVEEFVPDFSDSETSTGFCDLSDILSRLKKWQKDWPGIAPIIVLRRNYDYHIINLLSNFGCRFICGSRREISELIQFNDVLKENIIWANNLLTVADCSLAKASGVDFLQIGRISSLENILEGHPGAKVILNVTFTRSLNGIITQDQFVFGNSPSDFEKCLVMAKDMKINIVGIALTKQPGDIINPEELYGNANKFIEMAEAMGFQMEFISLPEIIQDLSIDSMMSNLKRMQSYHQTLHEKRSLPVKLFCENQDFLTTASLTIFTTVQSVRRMKIANTNEEKVQYFIDDGKFNSFRKVPQSIVYSDVRFVPRYYSCEHFEAYEKLFKSEIFGPSCDGDDLVTTVMLPQLENGDLICFTNVGTDTTATRTSFNGFLNCDIHHFANVNDMEDLHREDRLDKF